MKKIDPTGLALTLLGIGLTINWVYDILARW